MAALLGLAPVAAQQPVAYEGSAYGSKSDDSLQFQNRLKQINRLVEDPDRMRKLLMELEAEAQDAGQPAIALKVSIGLGHLELRQGKLLVAQALFRNARAKALELGDSNLSASAMIGMAQTAEWAGDYMRTEMRYENAIDAAKTVADSSVLGRVLLRQGGYFAHRKRFDKAEPILLHAERIFRQLGDSTRVGEIEVGRGLVERVKNNLPAALRHFRKGDRLLRNSDDTEAKVMAKRYISLLLSQQRQYTQAADVCRSGIAVTSAGQFHASEWLFRVDLANNLNKLGKTDSAIVLLNQVVAQAAGSPYPAGLTALNKAHALLSDLLAQQDPARALANHRLHMQLTDSLYRRDNALSREQAEFRYQNARRQQDYQLLEQQRELERARGNLLIGIISAIVLVTLFVLWRFIGQSRRNTDLRRQHRALAHANEEINRQMRMLDAQAAALQVASHEKDEVIGIAAHDLKNPIAAIRIFSSLLRDSPEQLSHAQVREFAGKIVQTSDQMMDIVVNLLDINQIEQGRLEVMLEAVDGGILADQIFAIHLERAEQKQISLQFETSEDLPLVQVDPRRMMQVLDNLVSNAIKFSPKGTNVFLRVLTEGEQVRFEVEDEGPGLQPQDRERLFQKFAKLSARPTAGESSTGLGLNIVHKLVNLMGGTVGVDSTPGKGATFYAVFPAAQQPWPAVAAEVQ